MGQSYDFLFHYETVVSHTPKKVVTLPSVLFIKRKRTLEICFYTLSLLNMQTQENHSTLDPNAPVADTEAAKSVRRFSYRDIWLIAYPILLSSLVEQLIGMTDTAFLGRVGEVELGASALGSIFFIAVFMLILGFCVGAQILMGRRNGEGNYEDIGVVFYHSLGFLTLLSVLLLVLTKLFAPMLLRILISSDAVFEASVVYLDWRMWGVFFSMVACLFRAFYVATTQTGVLKFNSAVMVAANVLFDYLLIFGHWGFPKMGIAGAAIASALASLCSMLFFWGHTRYKVNYAKYALNRVPRFKFRLLGKMLNVSMWTMVQNFFSLTTWFLFFVVIEHLGTRELAVTNVIRAISAFTYMSLLAFASTASTLTSNLIGAGQPDSVRPMIWRSIRLSCLLLIPIWIFIALFPEWVLSIFTNDAAIVAEGVAPLRMLGVSYFFQIPGLIYFQSVSGTGNTRTALSIELFALLLYSLFLYFVVWQMRSNLTMAWASEVVYAAPMMLLSILYLRFGNWRKKQL